MTTAPPTPAPAPPPPSPAPRPAPRHCARQPPPGRAAPQPPRRTVPEFRPIRRGGSGRYRLRQAVRHRPVLATGLLAAAAAIAVGPLRTGPAAPGASPIPAARQSLPASAAAPRCSSGH
ncbi:hypothetical protein [Kitasatospora kifunensis]|uniref:Uncharacterized protein n=1 Tax=Kitasatospora kifunensis TaxID=58351 RepID=A0A7W7R228_KITKI|nr:hypothetical protein [Kitasatospora kifunensis]MBB4923976.1 hypothetical protein [Kitasatospora kifunensis]